jgi:hypothetical protein
VTEQNGIDFRSISTDVDLDRRRRELEQLIKPFLSRTKTPFIIQFRGKRSFLKTNYAHHIVVALQSLYNLQAAIKAGEIERAMRMAIMFGEADFVVRCRDMFGVDPIMAAANVILTKTTRRNTRLGKTELKDVPDTLLQSIYAKHKGKRDWLKRVTAEVIERRGRRVVDRKTVSTELRTRGIVE